MQLRFERWKALCTLLLLVGLVLPSMAPVASAAPASPTVSAKGVTMIHFTAEW